jgi:leader peptidase (prepilin peptidase)/N-methyltransferase
LILAAAGLALGAGVSLAVAMAYSVVRRASGFGMGDVKLLGALGLYVGPYVLMVLFFGSLIGAVVGIALASSSRESLKAKKIPFGPMLALGVLWDWYATLAGLR